MSRKTLVTAAIGTAVLLFAAVAGAGSNINNGNFETGDFTAWNHTSTGDGDWFVSQKLITPLSGRGWSGPAEQEWAAVSDEVDPGTHVLYRDIKTSATKKTQISMFVYYKNKAGFFCNPDTLDWDILPTCNQQFRIDIMEQGSDPFSLDPGDIVKNLFRTKSSSPKNLKPTLMKFDIPPVGGTVMLRIVEVDNQDFFNASVDAVNINNG